MTQGELAAGADAVHKLASDKGYSAYMSEDLYRAIAAEVIRAVDKFRADKAKKSGAPKNPPSGGSSGKMTK
jgi:hypothetical protein